MPNKRKMKKELHEEQRGRCADPFHRGGKPRKLQLDRIIPGKHGGEYLPGNVQLLCPTCNQKKGAQLLPRG